jgi:uncharacterized coiled-coil protein SlyX
VSVALAIIGLLVAAIAFSACAKLQARVDHLQMVVNVQERNITALYDRLGELRDEIAKLRGDYHE